MKTTTNHTIGIDLGDRQHAVCVLHQSGEIAEELTIRNTREDLSALSGYAGSTAIMETGTHSPWVSRYLQQMGLKVIVANARKVRAIAKSDRKNDKSDARMLARLGRADPELLFPIRHRSEVCQRQLLTIKVRDAVVRTRVNQMNSIRFLLKSLGVEVPSGCNGRGFAARCREELNAFDLQAILPCLMLVEHCNDQIDELDQEIERACREDHPETERLRQIPGVGPVTALCFVLTLESPERFAHARDVGSYLGLVPRQDQSGNTDKQLRITKAGNKQLRALLINCAHYILGRYGPECDLRASGLRICERGGPIAKKKAVVATARKLAVTMLALWRSGQDYSPTKPRPLPRAA